MTAPTHVLPLPTPPAGPFSRSLLAGLGAGMAGADPARVAAPALAEGSGPAPPAAAPVPALPEGVVALPVPQAPAPAAAPAVPSLPPRSGLRLVPLDGFAWGARRARTVPRTRGDHLLGWVRAGSLTVDFPRRTLTLGAGGVLFVPAGTAFAAVPGPDAEGAVALIAPGLDRGLQPPLPTAPVAGQIGDAAPMLAALLADMAAEARAQRADYADAIGCHLALLGMRLARLRPPPEVDRQDRALRPDLALVGRFVALAGATLAEPATIADLAAALGTTTAALDRACQASHGRRAVHILDDLRCQRAMAAVRAGRGAAEVARLFGYAGHAHFTRAVAARTGRPPEALRPTAPDEPI